MSTSPFQQQITVNEDSAIGEARRVAARLATQGGFSETQVGKVSIVAMELATNLVRHGRGGELLVQRIETEAGLVLEMLALDRGPGMADPERCLRDGFSTIGTPGNGLGAVRRLSDEFDLYTHAEYGTAVVSRVAHTANAVARPKLRYGVTCIPMKGEVVCGDGWGFALDESGFTVMLVDGLGHGEMAAQAARGALQSFDGRHARTPSGHIDVAHQALMGTRGAAAAVAKLDAATGELRYAGLGNIAGSLIGGAGGRGLVSHNGMLGTQARRVQEFSYGWSADSVLVMHSDGLATRWQLDRYPGLVYLHPALVAGVLYRDYSRGRDDVTVLVASSRGLQ